MRLKKGGWIGSYSPSGTAKREKKEAYQVSSHENGIPDNIAQTLRLGITGTVHDNTALYRE